MRLGDLSDLGEGEMRCFSEAGANGVLVCRVDGELHAVDDQCTHARAPLSAGRLRGATVMCPLHGAAFDVRTGEHAGPPASRPVERFELRTNESETEVDIVIN